MFSMAHESFQWHKVQGGRRVRQGMWYSSRGDKYTLKRGILGSMETVRLQGI